MTVVPVQFIVIISLLGVILGMLFFMSTQITHLETRVTPTLDRVIAIEQGLQVK